MSLNSDNIEDDIEDEVPEFVELTDVLDLHGTPFNIIPELVNDFIDNAIELRLSHIQIIHGKGKSKLKHLVYQLVETHPHVVQFYDAPPQFGGWGRTILELDLTAQDV